MKKNSYLRLIVGDRIICCIFFLGGGGLFFWFLEQSVRRPRRVVPIISTNDDGGAGWPLPGPVRAVVQAGAHLESGGDSLYRHQARRYINWLLFYSN
jgi:hypothetical protein